MTDRPQKPRLSLFKKYFLAFFIAVTIPLLANGAVEAWFGYRDQRATIYARLKVEATAAAAEIRGFLDAIRDQMQWTVQLPWTPDSVERHRIDALRLLRQIPALVDVALIDGNGVERVRVSRIGEDVIESGIDRSAELEVAGARANGVWYGPVTLNRGSEPYMKVAIAGNRRAVGVVVAEINLTLIWNIVSAIRVGETGDAIVVDGDSRLVAHPNIALVLRGSDPVMTARLKALADAVQSGGGEPVTMEGANGRDVLAAMAPVAGVAWRVFVEQPVAEAYAPIHAAMLRTLFLMLAGAALAAALAFLLARRMTGPIQLLEEGAARIGAGRFDMPIKISTGDELEQLAGRFNTMAGELALSQERSERIARLKRFLSPQVAEIVERSGDGDMLEARIADVVVIFCDLRGFTSFSAKAQPEEIMRVLNQYHEVVGACISRSDATLTHFSGDGMMILLNAPVACPNSPVVRGIQLARQMQASVQELIIGWRADGHQIGFGIGVARGRATVGRIGYEGRFDYTAIGNVVNLASRLCSAAQDGQILIEENVVADAGAAVTIRALPPLAVKGLEAPVAVYEIA